MSKIVIDARESGTSTGRYVDKLVEHLHKLKPEFEIVILTKSHRLEYMRQIAPTFIIQKANIKEFTFAEQIDLARELYDLRPDLVHFSMTQQPLLYFGKTLTTVHDLTTARFDNPAKNRLIYKFKQSVYRGVIWLVAHKSKRLITPSEFVRKDLAKYTDLDLAKITVTYEAADTITEAVQTVKDLEKNKFIMYVGRPLPHKNLKRLIEAYIILRQSHPELKLALAGEKHTLHDQLKKWFGEAKMRGVIFTDFVSEGQLRWLYKNTAAYVFPSLSEGFGLPGLEAMAHGAPVVSSNATCLPEIYGSAAHYFEPKDIVDIANKIHEVLVDTKLRSKLITKGHQRAANFSWQKTAEQTLEVYSKLLEDEYR